MERQYELREKINEDFDLLRALTFGFANASKEFGEFPDEVKNYAEVTHLVFDRLADEYYELHDLVFDNGKDEDEK